jgi:7,8-dihydropterin-6-yl-methyl-4-(beta-D-ribofuranosyl)aminobenzene 5'-phosphate synthase
MEIRVTTLSENTANYGFLAEWGLSLLVEADNRKILFDCGLSHSAVHNATLLGIDLTQSDCIVLSHGHQDHTGGLAEVLHRCHGVPAIGHPDIWTAKYTQRSDPKPVYSGIPFSPAFLESLGARFSLSREPVRLSEHIMTTGEIPMGSAYENIEDNLFVKENGVLKPDPLADDLSLIINADFGLVVIAGCAHRGIINTLRHAQKLTGRQKTHTIIGGTHLYRASTERIDKTIADLKDMGVQRLGVSHCTGFKASCRLAQELGDAFFLNNAGNSFTL